MPTTVAVKRNWTNRLKVWKKRPLPLNPPNPPNQPCRKRMLLKSQHWVPIWKGQMQNWLKWKRKLQLPQRHWKNQRQARCPKRFTKGWKKNWLRRPHWPNRCKSNKIYITRRSPRPPRHWTPRRKTTWRCNNNCRRSTKTWVPHNNISPRWSNKQRRRRQRRQWVPVTMPSRWHQHAAKWFNWKKKWQRPKRKMPMI